MKKLLLILLVSLCTGNVKAQSGLCDAITPFFQVDLTGNPNGSWISAPPVVRDGLCCGNTNPDRCIEFEITLDPSAIAINFDIASGAIPSGSMFYQVDCNPPTPVGQPICLDGPGPYTLTFCKPGNNLNTYAITSYSSPSIDPDMTTTDNCQIQMNVYDVDPATITWEDITGGGIYNSFLSCTNCPTVYFIPHEPYPAYIDYRVCAMPFASLCDSAYWCDTIRVNLVPKLAITIAPDPASYCADQSGIQLTSNTTGGAQPFTYIWTDGSGTVVGNSSSYFASSPGTYFIEIRDTLYNQCGGDSASINVIMNPLPTVTVIPQISTICIGSSITITASGGSTYQWSNGS